MDQNKNNLLIETEEICTRLLDVVRNFPDAIHTSPDRFFEPSNLWKMEVGNTCSQVVEHYRGITKLIELGLCRPAMALSRSVHECYIRFIYLVRHEHELEDWFKWQLSRDFQFDCDRLDYDDGLKWNAKEELLREKRRIEELFGDAPSKGKPKWKTMSEMLKDVVEDDPPGTERRLYRYLISYPSTYVHTRTKLKTRWDVHLRGVGDGAGSPEIAFLPLIAGRSGSAVSPRPFGWSDRPGSC